VTVLEVIQRSTDYLAKKGVESPRLQIELLLSHVLGMPRLKLYLNFERSVTGPELAALRELVRRRGDREPLQHLTGSVSFCGFEIAVNRAVLIPRPETELLAERAWQFLATLNPQPSTVLDFGTGSGCLAIAIAAKCPAAVVHALEVSSGALAVARANVTRHGLDGRVRFIQGDGFGALPAGARFDLIVANPPYIPTAEIGTLQPEVREFDPRLALDGGPDGLDCIRRLAAEGGVFLSPAGRLMLEFGDGQGGAVAALFAAGGWDTEPRVADLAGRERFLIARPPAT
jgi:release factor glutamine methyltransferase